MIFISMFDGIKKNIYSFDLLESFSNGTPWLDCSCDLQGISYTKILLFLLTTLQPVLFLGLSPFSATVIRVPSLYLLGQDRNTMGLEVAAPNGTRPWWWVLSFTSALEWTRWWPCS